MKLLLIIFILISHFSFTQEAGYFGKKNVVSINGLGAIPIIQNLFSKSSPPYLELKNGKFIRDSDFFNGGFSAGFSHAFSNRFGLGIDFETVFSNCPAPNGSSGFYDAYYSQFVETYHEALSLRTYNFIPKIEFKLNSNQYPIGIVNQIGFGYSITKVIDKDYAFLVEYPTSVDLEKLEQDNYFNLNDNYSGLTFLYAFNVRVPVSKNLLFNYGIHYTINYIFGTRDGGNFLNNSTTDKENYVISKRSMQQIIGESRFKNIITLNIGLSLVI